MSWQMLVEEAPELATFGQRLIERFGIAYIATVSVSGWPRVHPICPLIVDGGIVVVIQRRSPKHGDLMRDGRVVLHALPSKVHSEFWIEGLAVPQVDTELARWSAADPRLGTLPEDSLFEIQLEAAHCTRYTVGDGGKPIPHRDHWRRRKVATVSHIQADCRACHGHNR